MESTTQPADLIIRPPEPAWVERLPNGECAVHWQEPVERIVIHVIDNPDLSAAPIATYEFRVSSAERSVVCDLSSVICESRPYFLIDLDGRRHVIAERELPLAGGVNFRDVGGYRTTDGRAVRWGRIYRAGSLAELTEADVTYLGRLGLRLSCDLRSREEVENNPDRLPPGAIARQTPIAAEVGRLRRLVTLFRLRRRIQKMLQQVYVIMLDQNGPLLAGILRAAADPPNLPLVIHCTAGKDRTGLAVALLLLSLGVPEETVIADYTLSNRAFGVLAERMRPELALLYTFGFSEERLRPFLLAEAPTLTGALAHLRRRYGSVEAYLRRAGLTGNDFERLRQTLLTADG